MTSARMAAGRAALGGVATGLALVAAAPPNGCAALAFVAFVPLFQIARTGLRHGALAGWIAGITFHVGVLTWLAPTIARLQGVGLVAASGWFGLFVAYHAGQFALAGAAAAWLQRSRSAAATPLCTAAAIAAAWLLLERGYPKVFPWTVGSALGPSPLLRQAADLAGAHGLTYAVVLMNALLAAAIAARHGARQWPLAAAAALLVSAAAYGATRPAAQAGPTAAALAPTIAIVQGNLAAGAPPLPATLDEAWRRYAQLTRSLTRLPDLIIWPERALPAYLRDNPELQRRLADLLRPLDCPLLLGALDAGRAATGERNSAYLVEPGGLAAVRHKTALVPFGEYVPGAQWWSALRRWRTTGEFGAGAGQAPLMVRLGDRPTALATTICFEAIHPGAFNAMVRDGAALLVNLTDDAWFVSRRAAAQHLEMTRLRAVETRRWLVRASNSGVSAFIDPNGRVVASLPFDRSGTLTHRAQTTDALSWYVRCGDAPLFAFAALALTAALLRAQREGEASAAPPVH